MPEIPAQTKIINMPVESRPPSDQRDCKLDQQSCDCRRDIEGCSRCRPRPMKMGLPRPYKKVDDPTVRLVSMKAVEEFNRRNRDRNLRLSEIVEARWRWNLHEIYDLTLLATEEEDVGEIARGPCTRSLAALKEKKAKSALKRRRPVTVRLGALVTVSPSKSKKIESQNIKVRVAVERANPKRT